MKSCQKTNSKEFPLSQYYQQLQKYESTTTQPYKAALKKEFSLSSFSKDASRTTHLSTTQHQAFRQQRSKLGINDNYTSKASFKNPDKNKLQNITKFSYPVENARGNSYLGESLSSSSVTCNQFNFECIQKENIPFTQHDQQRFTQHCCKLYGVKNGGEECVKEIAKQINKRDEVYEVVSQNFGVEGEGYGERLQRYFKQHQLMAKIIEEFKSISKIETKDLNQLYYFIKSDH